MKKSPEKQVVDKSLEAIKALVETMNAGNTDKLFSDLRDLESKISALRSFILNHIVRNAQPASGKGKHEDNGGCTPV